MTTTRLRFRGHTISAGILLLILTGPACHRTRQDANRMSRAQQLATDPCADTSAPVPAISMDSIGGLDLHATLAELRRRCPSARDTEFSGIESINQAVVFHVRSLRVIATQLSNAVINPDEPAEIWWITGRSATLPLGVPLTAPWSLIRQTYGRGVASWNEGTIVTFCRFPGLELVIDRGSVEGALAPTDDLSFIAGATRLEEVRVISDTTLQLLWEHKGSRLHC